MSTPASASIAGLTPETAKRFTYMDVTVDTVSMAIAGDFTIYVVTEGIVNTFKALVIFHRELAGTTRDAAYSDRGCLTYPIVLPGEAQTNATVR